MTAPASQTRDSLLTTKFNPPLIRSDILDRPQLLTLLERDTQRPLTVISAPAGYGKSTLTAQWLECSTLPNAWISLDESDNDARVFLSYVVAAVRGLEPGACSRIHDLLEAAQFPPSEVLARLLANDLEEISRPFLLVLDDFHLINDPVIHDVLDRLLQHPPRCLHLVLVTRRDPPYPLVTMKARGLAVEIRESDLQFNSQETSQLLKQIGDIHLDDEGLDRVMDDFEGWITGLRLFCLALAKGEDPKVYLLGMSGGATHVQDYLVEQVLSRQLPEMQDCLLRTSILDRFCAPLCEAVCSGSLVNLAGKKPVDGQTFMSKVVEAKLFGVQLEAGGLWIRYHHLFQELLRSHLHRKSEPGDIKALHRRAALWFSEQGLTDEALKHARAAGESELAVRIIEDKRLEAINGDRWANLMKWLDALPPGVESSRPHLLMSRAYLLLHHTRHIAGLPALLEKVVSLAGEEPADPMLAGELNFFRGIPTFRTGNLEKGKELFISALQHLPETNEEARSLSEMYAYVIQHMEGHGKVAVDGLRALIQQQEPRSPHYQGRLVFGLSYIHALAGRWPESSEAAEHLVTFSQPAGLSFAVAWGFYMQGIAHLQTLDLDEADRYFVETLDRRYIKNAQAAIDAFMGYALCLQLQGKEDEADKCLAEARDFAYWTGDPAKIDIIDSGRARIALLRGDRDAASRWLAAGQLKPDVPVRMFFLEYPEITACRVLVARGTPDSLDKAEALIERVADESRRFHHVCQLVPVLVLKCMLYGKTDRQTEALELLAEAVNLAWPGRWTLPFVEGGPVVAKLLRQLPVSPEWGGFVPLVLAHFGPDPEQLTGHAVQKDPVVDLTNRERDVLELVCKRLYDKEIAARLFISPATVKTHLSHIYSKLEVANRREAARKARELGYLGSEYKPGLTH